jgi:hypothetical protein
MFVILIALKNKFNLNFMGKKDSFIVQPDTLKVQIFNNIDAFENWNRAKQAVPVLDAYTYDRIKQYGTSRIKSIKDLDMIV